MPKLISSYYLIDTLVKTTSPREGCALTPRQAEVPTPIRLLAVPTVFKTVLTAGRVNLPYGGALRPHFINHDSDIRTRSSRRNDKPFQKESVRHCMQQYYRRPLHRLHTASSSADGP